MNKNLWWGIGFIIIGIIFLFDSIRDIKKWVKKDYKEDPVIQKMNWTDGLGELSMGVLLIIAGIALLTM